ncbi:hypothetical protein [Azospirillum sp.]|uniref:hypothetical protein n=1 Tax=Azospirillum sp. TaxID=34012 RepID=UPI002D62E71C|nr:hypothetical protein [Azospirillum sp.]HYD68954.1 hypothetical protein [Azospirillum sp.]
MTRTKPSSAGRITSTDGARRRLEGTCERLPHGEGFANGMITRGQAQFLGKNMSLLAPCTVALHEQRPVSEYRAASPHRRRQVGGALRSRAAGTAN